LGFKKNVKNVKITYV